MEKRLLFMAKLRLRRKWVNKTEVFAATPDDGLFDGVLFWEQRGFFAAFAVGSANV
jgi:hypothetical protein